MSDTQAQGAPMMSGGDSPSSATRRPAAIPCCRTLHTLQLGLPDQDIVETPIQIREYDGALYVLGQANNNTLSVEKYTVLTKLGEDNYLHWRVRVSSDNYPVNDAGGIARMHNGKFLVVGGFTNYESSPGASPPAGYMLRINAGGDQIWTHRYSPSQTHHEHGQTFEGMTETASSGGETQLLICSKVMPADGNDFIAVYRIVDDNNNPQPYRTIRPAAGDNNFVFKDMGMQTSSTVLLLGDIGHGSNRRSALYSVDLSSDNNSTKRYVSSGDVQFDHMVTLSNNKILLLGKRDGDTRGWILNRDLEVSESFGWQENAPRFIGDPIMLTADDYENVYFSAVETGGDTYIYRVSIRQTAVGGTHLVHNESTRHKLDGHTSSAVSPPVLGKGEDGRHLLYANKGFDGQIVAGRLPLDLVINCMQLQSAKTSTIARSNTLSSSFLGSETSLVYVLLPGGFDVQNTTATAAERNYCITTGINCSTQNCPVDTYGRFTIARPSDCAQGILKLVVRDAFARIVRPIATYAIDDPLLVDISGEPPGLYYVDVLNNEGQVLYTVTVSVVK